MEGMKQNNSSNFKVYKITNLNNIKLVIKILNYYE